MHSLSAFVYPDSCFAKSNSASNSTHDLYEIGCYTKATMILDALRMRIKVGTGLSISVLVSSKYNKQCYKIFRCLFQLSASLWQSNAYVLVIQSYDTLSLYCYCCIYKHIVVLNVLRINLAAIIAHWQRRFACKTLCWSHKHQPCLHHYSNRHPLEIIMQQACNIGDRGDESTFAMPSRDPIAHWRMDTTVRNAWKLAFGA